MDEFRRAEIRHQRKAAKQVMDMGAVFEPPRPILHLPKKEQPVLFSPTPSKKNADEISVRVTVGDRVIALDYETKITGTLLDSQINQEELGRLFLKILTETFGRVKLK
jgi:hypothetical protein